MSNKKKRKGYFPRCCNRPMVQITNGNLQSIGITFICNNCKTRRRF